MNTKLLNTSCVIFPSKLFGSETSLVSWYTHTHQIMKELFKYPHPGATRTPLWFVPDILVLLGLFASDTLVLLGHPYGLHPTSWCY